MTGCKSRKKGYRRMRIQRQTMRYAIITMILLLLWTVLAIIFIPGSITSYAKEDIEVIDVRTLPIEEYAKLEVTNLWDADQWVFFNKIINKESNWNSNAQNQTSSAYGLAQFLNSTWDTVDCIKTPDPYTQIDCAITYIENRYDTPDSAWSHHISMNWY